MLGPLLFILYINDLSISINDNIILFADDTAAIYDNINNELLTECINRSLFNLTQWFNDNSLKLNLEKTQYITFGKYGSLNHNLVLPDFGAIHFSEVVKFLGIHIDNNLSWKQHIDYLVNIVNKYIFLIRSLNKTVPCSVLLNIYYAYVHSRLSYGIIFWGRSVSINYLFKVQKRCIRAICNKGPRTSCRPLFQKLKILTVHDIYVLESSIFVKKYPFLFTNNAFHHSYTTRNKNDLVITQTHLNKMLKGPLNSLIKIFNNIPQELKFLPIDKFKIKFKNYLTNISLYTLEEFFSFS